MKHKLDWFLVLLCSLGYLFFVIGTLNIAYRIDYSLGIAISGAYLWYFSIKLLNRNKL